MFGAAHTPAWPKKISRLDQVGIFLYDEDFEDEVLMDSNYIVPNRAKNIFVRVLVP